MKTKNLIIVGMILVVIILLIWFLFLKTPLTQELSQLTPPTLPE